MNLMNNIDVCNKYKYLQALVVGISILRLCVISNTKETYLSIQSNNIRRMHVSTMSKQCNTIVQ